MSLFPMDQGKSHQRPPIRHRVVTLHQHTTAEGMKAKEARQFQTCSGKVALFLAQIEESNLRRSSERGPVVDELPYGI